MHAAVDIENDPQVAARFGLHVGDNQLALLCAAGPVDMAQTVPWTVSPHNRRTLRATVCSAAAIVPGQVAHGQFERGDLRHARIDKERFRVGLPYLQAEQAERVGGAQRVRPQAKYAPLAAMGLRPPLIAAACAATYHLAWIVSWQKRAVGKLQPVQRQGAVVL